MNKNENELSRIYILLSKNKNKYIKITTHKKIIKQKKREKKKSN